MKTGSVSCKKGNKRIASADRSFNKRNAYSSMVQGNKLRT